jgi:hypothetical protein
MLKVSRLIALRGGYVLPLREKKDTLRLDGTTKDEQLYIFLFLVLLSNEYCKIPNLITWTIALKHILAYSILLNSSYYHGIRNDVSQQFNPCESDVTFQKTVSGK